MNEKHLLNIHTMEETSAKTTLSWHYLRITDMTLKTNLISSTCNFVYLTSKHCQIVSPEWASKLSK